MKADAAILSVPMLIEEAALRAGLPDRELPFTDTLELLVASCLRSGKLNGTGLTVLRKVALRHLRNLLELQAYVDAHQEVTQRQLDVAVVVTGLPRTGTTLLHNLLALDPAHRVLRFWEALSPLPVEPGGPLEQARQAQAQAWLDAFYRLVPEFRSIHPATAGGPEECDALLQNTFASQHFDDMFDAEEYSAWLATAPLADEYAHYALQLRVLTAPSPDGMAWALKSPSHLGHLDALQSALPGCAVVVCHRHPFEAVASYANLMFSLRRPYGNNPSPTAVGRQALDRAATAMGRALAVRAAADGAAFIDVSYSELEQRPVPAVRGIYERLQRALDPKAEQRMGRWVVENPRHKHGPHNYDLSRFGLDEAEVETAFGPYMEQFGSLVS